MVVSPPITAIPSLHSRRMLQVILGTVLVDMVVLSLTTVLQIITLPSQGTPVRGQIPLIQGWFPRGTLPRLLSVVAADILVTECLIQSLVRITIIITQPTARRIA